MIRFCAQCNDPLLRYQEKYCCKACVSLAMAYPPKRNCIQCGKTLRGDQKSSCSLECQQITQPGHSQATKDRVAKLWVEMPEISSRLIGLKMDPPMNKNQIISLVHRMRLPARKSPLGSKAGHRAPQSAPPEPRAQRPPTGPMLRLKGPSPARPVVKQEAPKLVAKAPTVVPTVIPRDRPAPVDGGGRVCEWIASDGRPWTKCGCPVTRRRIVWTSDGKPDQRWSSWCEEHHRIVYQSGTAVAA